MRLRRKAQFSTPVKLGLVALAAIIVLFIYTSASDSLINLIPGPLETIVENALSDVE